MHLKMIARVTSGVGRKGVTMTGINRLTGFRTPEDVTDVIQNYIYDFESSDKRNKMRLGVDYYRSENTEIMNRRKLIYTEDSEGNPIAQDDPYKANNKLGSGFFKILVDQKVSYLLGNEYTFDVADQDSLTETLPRTMYSKVVKAAREASKKSRAWLQVYVDESGELGVENIPSEQIIPVYKSGSDTDLELVIRYYKVTVMNSDGEVVNVNRVEAWDDEQVVYYQQNKEGGLYYLLDEQQMESIYGKPYSNPKYHFEKNLKYGDKITKVEGHSWGQVPFVPLYNNDDEDYDLQSVKRYIDAYDIVNSDFINNLEDFQEAFWILKGYNGENLNKFLQEVKTYKTLKISEDGDAKRDTLDIPYQARKEALQGLEKDIFTFGQGVNPNQLGDGNITNIVIKSRFANLDLKCDQFEDEVRNTIMKISVLMNRYREVTNAPVIEVDDVIFDRSLMVNQVEILKASREQMGVVSDKTRLANHPWVSDVEQEQEQLEEEMSDYTDLDNVEDTETGSDE